MPGAILLIRHGETAWNREKIFRGAHDVPLNENGRAQAALAARARSAQNRCGLYKPAQPCPGNGRNYACAALCADRRPRRLKDFHFGEWTGQKDEAVAEQWPGAYALWSATPHLAQPPGGDTLASASARVRAALDEIARRHSETTVALFTHRIVNKLLVLAMLGLPLDRFKFIRQDNSCINEFEVTPEGYVAVSLNDVSHLSMSGTSLVKADF
ncbi:MAG: histidine phosphatase family protein [Kiritimatiellae bacterium]|nr:histidine phosphatase family protein [Kiritimatiellia bacterium]